MPRVDEDGNPIPDGPITLESVTANLDKLLEVLRASASDCEKYTAVVTGMEGYSSTPFANIAGEKLAEADRIHREGVGEVFQHFPNCPLAGHSASR